jgi:hypothetical protein
MSVAHLAEKRVAPRFIGVLRLRDFELSRMITERQARHPTTRPTVHAAYAMRLRLSIRRHALPPAEVLWNVSEEQALKLFSIAQLLEEINHIIPLESQDWGLEDYVVEVGGFECFHFAQVAQVLKDEDRIW